MKNIRNIFTLVFAIFSLSVFSDSKNIFYRAHDGSTQHAIYFYSKNVAPKSALFFVHGMQSHAEWMKASGVGEALAEQGILVMAYDRRGSGQSSTLRGHAESPSQLMNDMTDALKAFQAEAFEVSGVDLFKDLEVHAMANCFGVRLLVPYIVQGLNQSKNPFASMTLIAPSTHMRSIADYSLAQKISILAKRDRSYMPTPLKDEWFVSSGSGLDWIRSDPLGLRQVTVRFLKTARSLTRIMSKNVYDMKIPMMVIVAEDDVMVDSEGVYKDLYVPYAGPKKFVNAPGEHSLEFGAGREALIEATLDWVLGN
jgi:alpha-beta hydrolase superfamily lysophospholipase